MRKKFYLVLFIIGVFCLVSCGTSTGDHVTVDNDKIEMNEEDIEDDYLEGEEAEWKEPDDYDELLASDDTYSLYMKTVSGFDDVSDLYGIYNNLIGEWAVEYTEIPEPHSEFCSAGEGVFVCEIYDYIDEPLCFFSVNAAEPFKIHSSFKPENLWFVEGKALVTESVRSNAIKGGATVPTEELYWINTKGENIEQIVINVHDNDSTNPEKFLDWQLVMNADSESFVCEYSKNGDDGIYVYLFKEEKTFLIEDQEIVERCTMGWHPDNDFSVYYEQHFYIDDNKFVIENMEGEDDNPYYVEYDFDGNMITPQH